MVPRSNSGGEEKQRAQILEALLRRYHGTLLHQARRNSDRDHDAGDALGNAAIQFLRHYDGPPGVDALRWMMLVTKRCAWALNKSARRHEEITHVDLTDTIDPEERSVIAVDEGSGPAEWLVRNEDTAEVAELLANLKRDERTALILLGLGYSYEEIAASQGWTRTKVNRCLAEGREAVREALRGRES